ncbi:MAG: hypothetical protein WEA56_03440 [Balneolaceae bacterium]
MKSLVTVVITGVFFCFSWFQHDKLSNVNTGSIEGTIVLASQQSPVQVGGIRYGRSPQNTGTSKAAEDSILIWLVGTDNIETASPGIPVILDQKDLKFSPSLLAVRQNSKIRIQNSDPVYHNVFSLSSTKKFDVGRRPENEYMDVTFDKPGIVDVFCDIHTNMHAVIYVMPPDVLTWTKAKSGDTFYLTDIPEGTYQLKLYAPGAGESSIPIEVSPEQTFDIGTITLNS